MSTRPAWKPPVVPARKAGWEAGYVATIERHMAEPFAYGQSDCLLVAADLCKAMTGVDPMRGLRRYRGETSAMRLLARLGFQDVEQALEAVFPRIAQAQALRGDCGIIERVVDGKLVKSTAIVLDQRAFAKNAAGPVIVPALALTAAFAIGGR